MKQLFFAVVLSLVSLTAYASNTPQPTQGFSGVSVSSIGVAGNQTITVIVSSPTGSGAYSLGYYNYISSLHVVAFATATVTGSTTPITCTFSNMPNSTSLLLPTATTAGKTNNVDMDFKAPISANQGAQVAITCPAAPGIIWELLVNYFQAP